MNNAQLGQRARELLADPAVTEILSMIEQTLTQTWKDSTETTAREDAWYTLRGHQRFINILETLDANAHFEATLEEENDA